MNSFSLWSLFTSDVVTAIASIVLVIFSVLSWAVIIEKIRLFRAVRHKKPNGNPDDVIAPFDKNLWFLAMVAGVAPFIGLFGTVWGVMDSFASVLVLSHLDWQPHWARLHWDLLPQYLRRSRIRYLPKNLTIFMRNWVGNNYVQTSQKTKCRCVNTINTDD